MKLSSACFAIRSLKPLLTLDDLKIVYFAYVHSIITYGIAFCGNATNSKNVFIVQKRIIRDIINANPKASCWRFFKHLNILPFYSQYNIFSLLLLIVKNMHLFVINTKIYTINTRQSINLHLPSVRLTKCKKGVYYMGTEISNHLSHNIRELSNDVNNFKLVTKNFLLNESFYSINEYLDWSVKRNQNPM
jgi:hypothetical protein